VQEIIIPITIIITIITAIIIIIITLTIITIITTMDNPDLERPRTNFLSRHSKTNI
jgi:hypothetical protein